MKLNDPSRIIEIFFNGLADKVVKGEPLPSQQSIQQSLLSFNLPFTEQIFNKILSSPYVDNTEFNKRLLQASARDNAQQATNALLDRVNRNIDYIDELTKQANVDIQKYTELAKKLSPEYDRRTLLERAIEQKENLTTGKHLDYKRLQHLRKELNHYTMNERSYQEKLLMNKTARDKGLPEPYKYKIWHHNPSKNTRHDKMEGEKVEIEEDFEVVNSSTMKSSMGRFPRDQVNLDIGNLANCKCYLEYTS